jgi:hypothetical protein
VIRQDPELIRIFRRPADALSFSTASAMSGPLTPHQER